ncbi:MAG: molybdenum cofactor guanylyltransferase [Actinobacteria bacterium]|nr:MAG: molybdenum cofactor guanylyltransferase [Actinomycetota bacterium]TMK67892.1 MAG: molybdenum cofactor guanylyltransferase [Actinomycetota bacterium]
MHQGPVRLRVRAEPRAGPARGRALTPENAHSVTGIVLAGGRASRFGRDKLREPYRGVPLLHHAVLRISEVCPMVVVVAGPEGPDPDLPAGPTLRLAHDPVEGRGPLAGLAAGLAEVRTELALVAGGDMPDMSPSVLLAMVAEARRSGADAVALEQGGTLQPLPVVLRAEPASRTAQVLLAEEGERSLMGLLAALRVRRVGESAWRALDPQGTTARDIDRPEDLGG